MTPETISQKMDRTDPSVSPIDHKNISGTNSGRFMVVTFHSPVTFSYSGYRLIVFLYIYKYIIIISRPIFLLGPLFKGGINENSQRTKKK